MKIFLRCNTDLDIRLFAKLFLTAISFKVCSAVSKSDITLLIAMFGIKVFDVTFNPVIGLVLLVAIHFEMNSLS